MEDGITIGGLVVEDRAVAGPVETLEAGRLMVGNLVDGTLVVENPVLGGLMVEYLEIGGLVVENLEIGGLVDAIGGQITIGRTHAHVPIVILWKSSLHGVGTGGHGVGVDLRGVER